MIHWLFLTFSKKKEAPSSPARSYHHLSPRHGQRKTTSDQKMGSLGEFLAILRPKYNIPQSKLGHFETQYVKIEVFHPKGPMPKHYKTARNVSLPPRSLFAAHQWEFGLAFAGASHVHALHPFGVTHGRAEARGVVTKPEGEPKWTCGRRCSRGKQ